MNGDLLIYDVQTGDTLASIGEKIGCSGDEIRNFHNRHCQEAGLLWISSLVGISRIVIPARFENPEETRKLIKKLLPSEPYSGNFLAETYKVTETLKQSGEKTAAISYKTDIKFRENPQKGWIADIRNFEHKKDGQKVDDKMGGLALAAIEAVSPLSLTVSETGSLLGFENLKLIQEKFKAGRTEIEDFYVGETAAAYLDRFSENIQAEDYFFRQISTAMPYYLLFPEIGLFQKTESFQRKFHVYRNSFPVNCGFTVTHNFADDDSVTTVFDGKIKESCSLLEVLRGVRFDPEPEELLDGDVKITYETSKKTKKLLRADLEITLRFEGEVYFEHFLNLEE